MKRIIAFLLCALILLCFAGCSVAPNGGESDPPAMNYDILYEYGYNNDEYCTYYMTVTAHDENGELVWTYRSPDCLVGQCEGLQLMGVRNGLVYLNECGICVENPDGGFPLAECRLTALSITDGSIKWHNSDFDGSGAVCDFDEEGNIYIAGYLGPDCVKIDKDGKTVWRIPYIDSDYYWIYDIDYDNGSVFLSFEMGANEESCVVKISSDGKIIEK